jgi:hypothetical protein
VPPVKQTGGTAHRRHPHLGQAGNRAFDLKEQEDQPRHSLRASRGHYTKRQKSYGKTSLHKPVAIVEPIAIPFCKPKGGDLRSERGSCANVRFRNTASG